MEHDIKKRGRVIKIKKREFCDDNPYINLDDSSVPAKSPRGPVIKLTKGKVNC